jgi:hypothetical protein
MSEPIPQSGNGLTPREARRFARSKTWLDVTVMVGGQMVVRGGRVKHPEAKTVWVGSFVYLYREIKYWKVVQ